MIIPSEIAKWLHQIQVDGKVKGWKRTITLQQKAGVWGMVDDTTVEIPSRPKEKQEDDCKKKTT